MDWGDSRRPAKAVLKRSCSAYSIASSTDFFAEEIQPAVAMGFGGGWMRRKFPALIPVAGNHFGPGDGSGRLFRLGLENDQSVRRCLASSKSVVPRLIRWVPLPSRQQRYQAALPVRCPSQQLGFQQSAGLLPASDENESSTEFPNGRRKTFPNALKSRGRIPDRSLPCRPKVPTRSGTKISGGSRQRSVSSS